MSDLQDIKPTYISNWTVDQWRKTKRLSDPTYSVMVVSPDLIERVDRQPDDKELQGTIKK